MRIVQIGTGGWGRSWLKLIHETTGCELAGLVSRGGENLVHAKNEWGLTDEICFTDIDRALEIESDLVLITVPHHLHLEYAEKAARAGRNVLIEKPLSDDFAAAGRFVVLAEALGARAWVSQNFRNRLQLWKMRASLSPAGAGNPLWITIDFRQGENSRRPQSWRTEGPEVVTCEIEFANGARASYHGATEGIGMQTGWQAHWFVQTDQGSIQWVGNDLSLTASREDRPRMIEATDFPEFDREGVLLEIAKGIQGLPCNVPTVSDNLRSFAMVKAAEMSLREGRPVAMEELL